MRTFRVHVTNFLDFECPFKASGIPEDGDQQTTTKTQIIYTLISSTHEQQTLIHCDSSSKLFELAVELKDFLDLTRQSMQTVNDLVPPLGEGDSVLRQLESDYDESDILRSICLEREKSLNIWMEEKEPYFSRSNANFWTGVDVNTAVSLARQRRTDSVDDTNTQSTSLHTIA